MVRSSHSFIDLFICLYKFYDEEKDGVYKNCVSVGICMYVCMISVGEKDYD